MDNIYAEEKMSGKSLVEVLRKVELFKSFSEETLNILAEHSKQIWLGDQDVLCKEGDPGDKMWVVVSGRVMVFKLKKTIAFVEECSFIGEMSLIDNLPRSASIRGIGDVHLLEIDDDLFNKYIIPEPQAMVPFIQGITARMCDSLDTIVEENQRLNCLVHDMRNYLVPISISEVHMSLLLKSLGGTAGQKKRKGFDGLSTALKKMLAVRDNLITLIDQTLAMVVKSKAEYVKKPANLSEMVKETVEETIYHKKLQDKELKAHVPEDFNKETLCNVLDIKRVLQNLIVNAGYASDKGGKIEVYLKDTGDGAKIIVVDHGSGIPEDIKPLLLKEKYTSKPDGNGFGLLSCREIVEDYHDGAFGFDSKVGKGSTFYFSVPD